MGPFEYLEPVSVSSAMLLFMAVTAAIASLT